MNKQFRCSFPKEGAGRWMYVVSGALNYCFSPEDIIDVPSGSKHGEQEVAGVYLKVVQIYTSYFKSNLLKILDTRKY